MLTVSLEQRSFSCKKTASQKKKVIKIIETLNSKPVWEGPNRTFQSNEDYNLFKITWKATKNLVVELKNFKT